MYDRVYAEMVNSKVATPMEKLEYYFINIPGIKVKTEEEAAGHHIKHNISHPQYVLSRDELYTDTNQMHYRNNGGQRYIIIKVMRTNLLLSKSSGRFRFMGLNAATVL